MIQADKACSENSMSVCRRQDFCQLSVPFRLYVVAPVRSFIRIAHHALSRQKAESARLKDKKPSRETFRTYHKGNAYRGNRRLYIGNAHDIGEHARSSHGSAGTVALYLHGVFLVTFCGEEDNVVGSFEVVERME